MHMLADLAREFWAEDDGAQVIEYALIIALISVVLVIALSPLTGTNMSGWVARVGACLTTNTCV